MYPPPVPESVPVAAGPQHGFCVRTAALRYKLRRPREGETAMKHVGLVLCVSTILSAPALAQDDLARWRYWKTIKLDTTASGAKVKGDVKNFPVPVLLDSSNFDFAQAAKDGADVRFSKTAKGEPLAYSIESW